MRISVLNDLKVFDAGSRHNLEKVVVDLKVEENDFTLDLSKCIIDYPATSYLIDNVIEKLYKLNGEKHLKIQSHLNMIELLLLHWLFIGSVFFNIDPSQRKNSVEEFREILSAKLKSSGIKLDIEVVDKAGNSIVMYNYGY